MFDLSGKIALVTGASRGLGWAMSKALAASGAYVIINARSEEVLERRKDELLKHKLKAEISVGDATDQNYISGLVRGLIDRHSRLDIVVGNVGVTHRSTIDQFSMSDFQRVIDTNLMAFWALAREASKVMARQKNGRIIVTGSISGMLGRSANSGYMASKGALHAMTKGLAVELAGKGITVNAIAPGYFVTDMNKQLFADKKFKNWVCDRTPVGRWGKADEIGPAAVFLASDEAAFVNGHILVVDGGFSIAM